MSIFGFQALDGFGEEEGATGMSVILFPGTLAFRRKRDEAMYIVALLARDLAPMRAKFEREETFEYAAMGL